MNTGTGAHPAIHGLSRYMLNRWNSDSALLDLPSSNSFIRPLASKSRQITPPHTPSTSTEDLTPQPSAGGPRFHEYLRAFYPFHPPCDSDTSTVTLPLNQGDIVLIHSVHTTGWADGTLLDSGHRGWLPTNYCEAYDAIPMRSLMRALTTFWDAVRSGSEGNIMLFQDQIYTRGLIAGVRHLLVGDGRSTKPK